MKAIQQITLRLPQDLAQRLAECTPSRKRNQFVMELVRRELDRERLELEEAAKRLSSLEAGQTAQDAEWLGLEHGSAWGEFDEQRFMAGLRTQVQKSPKAARSVPV